MKLLVIYQAVAARVAEHLVLCVTYKLSLWWRVWRPPTLCHGWFFPRFDALAVWPSTLSSGSTGGSLGLVKIWSVSGNSKILPLPMPHSRSVLRSSASFVPLYMRQGRRRSCAFSTRSRNAATVMELQTINKQLLACAVLT